ncbi:MAG: VCBS repeat-containing protein [Calditrichaeota bacterium]|nr:VCBS repeat-containing protein [Calditrichota bacterium]
MKYRFWNIVFTAFTVAVLNDAAVAQTVTFENVATVQGVQHMYVNHTFYGGGVSFADFDGDGRDDLTFATGEGEALMIYRNVDGNTFTEVAAALNVTDNLESKTVLWVDYDNDGDRDLFIANYYGSSKLFANQNGVFADVTTAAGLIAEDLTTIAACWADFNNDGWLDVYLTNHSPAIDNVLFQSNGDGTFADVTAAAGVADAGKNPLAVVAIDYDVDGWQDIYIGSDRFFGNSLLRNNGNGTFSDVSVASGSNLSFHSMGITVGDYDADGDLDMYVSNDPFGNGLLRNNGDGTFSEVADAAGVAVNKACWGVNFFDFDNDGDLDLFVAVATGLPNNWNVLYENLGDGTFSQTSGIGMDGDASFGYGSAIGDVDGNGYPDVAVLNELGPSDLWKNSGGSNNWVKLALEGTVSNRDAVGSLLEIYHGGKRQLRSIHCGTSYLSQHSSTETIGLGSDLQIDSLRIRWPSGTEDVVQNLAAGQIWQLREGQGITGIPVETGENPAQFRLDANYPNPFNPQTTIRYSLSEAAQLSLKIVDVQGKQIATLAEGFQSAGEYQVEWNGSDELGNPVASGVYFYQLRAGDFRQVRKMMLVR